MHRVLAFVACLAAVGVPAQPAIVPQPAAISVGNGELALVPASGVAEGPDAGTRRAAARLKQLVAGSTRVSLATTKSGTAAIRFERSQDASLGDEGYRIEVTPRAATVTARGDAGLQHGATTLWQLVRRRDGRLAIPALRIEDAPRLAWRGILLDSARHFQSPEFVHRFLDWMAAHKLNVLHWHLTDDQAWRVQIRKYPKLTDVGAWRVPAGAGREDIDPATKQPRRYGGFYSQATVREIVRHATDLGITIVPEIDMPGHATAAIAAYPRLAAIDNPPRAVPADWGIYPHVYSLEESTFAFIEDVLEELMQLFPGPYIHIGGDEVIKDEWTSSPRAKARMRELGIGEPAKLQPYFTERLAHFLQSRGRRLVGWDEVLEPGLPRSSVVMSWRGNAGAVQAARKGYDTVVAAHPTLYFDNRQSARRDEPPGRVAVVSLEDVYRYEPVPAELTPEEARHVIGVQGNVWTEHIRTEERVAVMTFPRAAAIAETGWSQPQRRDWTDFRRRLDALMSRYETIGLGAAARAEAKRREPPPPVDPLRRTSHDLKLCSEDIALMLEDDAPPRGPRATFVMDIQNPCWIYPAASGTARALRATVGQVPFNFQIGDAVKKITFPKPRTAVGELEVRAGRCDGDVIARLPLAPAARSNTLTTLPPVALPAGRPTEDLCLRFAQPALEPMWAIDRIELLENRP